MKKSTTTISILLLLAVNGFAQNEAPEVSKSLVSMYVLPLKISYEAGLGESNTLEFSAGVSGSATFENDQFKYSLVPNVEGSYKYYYNLHKRQSKGKNTAMNSGNFWGLKTRYGFKSITENGNNYGSLFVGPMWGLQRNYPSRFSLGFRLGYGFVITQHNSFLNPFIDFKLGFVLFAKQ